MKYTVAELTKFFVGSNTDAKELADILEIDRDHVIGYLYRGAKLPIDEEIAIDSAIRIIKAKGWKRKDLWEDSYDQWLNDTFGEDVRREVEWDRSQTEPAVQEIIMILTPCDKRIFTDVAFDEPLHYGGLDKYSRESAIKRAKKRIAELMF